MSTPPTDDRSRGNRRWLVLAVTLLIVAVPVSCIAYVARELFESDRHAVRRSQEDLDRQLSALRAGKANSVYLYDTRRTDALLRQLEGMAEVEELTIELADATDAGVASIATLPRLRKLVLYGGRGFTNRGLAELKGMASLEALELKNTLVTNEGLRALHDLPNLRELTIFCEPRLGVLNDAGLAHLKGLPKLKKLTLTGGWASREGMVELQAQLPNCKVFTDARGNSPSVDK